MIAVYLILIAVLLLTCAFFAAADTAFTSVNRLRLEKAAKKKKVAKRALKFLQHYDQTISTILFGNDLAAMFIPSIGTLLAYRLWGVDAPWAVPLMTAILIFLVLLFGEILPKSLAKTHNYGFALFSCYPILICSYLFFPFVWVTTKIAQGLRKPLKSLAEEEENPLSDEELLAMVDEIEDEGIIDESKSELLHRSIEFKETTAEEIMTPRVRIVGYNATKPLSKWVQEPGVLSHSRIIVYKKFFDQILGYIPTKTLLKAMLDERELDYRDLMLPILAVPSTMEISAVLRLMKKSHHHIAVVKDEYGGTDGIITLEDILEELVGELYDESEKIELDVIPGKKRNVFLVSGKMSVDDFFHRFRLDKEGIDEDYNTVSGWINDQLGRFAKEGDHFSYERVDILVKKVSDYTVSQAEVVFHPRKKID
ncbi:MAG: HlyC/CorC family transporter [Bacilli bacterium]|nr:HlyC/CorC family transporter [Bacilli bacterium]